MGKLFTLSVLQKNNFIGYLGVIIVIVVLCLVHYPGHLSYDSIVQLYEGRTGSYTSAHPPLMSFILGIGDRIIPGTGFYLVFNVVIFTLGLFLFIRDTSLSLFAKTLSLLGLSFFPVVFVYNGIVWKDVLFANLSLLGFGVLLAAHRITRNFLTFTISIVIFTVASLVRQQGSLVFAVVAIMAAFTMVPNNSPSVYRDRMLVLLGVISIWVSVTLCINYLIRSGAYESANAPSVFRVSPVWSGGLTSVMIYDLAGITAHAPEIDYKILSQVGVDIDGLRNEFLQHYKADRIDWLFAQGNAFKLLANVHSNDIMKEWVNAVANHPTAYLKHRLNVFLWQLGFYNVKSCLPYHVGTSAQPAELVYKLQLAPGISSRAEFVRTYADFFVDLFRPILYVIAGLITLVVYIRRGWATYVVPITLQIAGLVFASTFFVIGIACDFRYMYFSCLASLVGVVYAIGRTK